MNKFMRIFLLSSFFVTLTGCMTDAEMAKQQQCASLRYELTKVHSNPNLIKSHMGTRRYADMRAEYGSLDCKSIFELYHHQ